MRVLMVGDVVGKPGRRMVTGLLPRLREEHQIDLIIANGENAAGGRGLTPSTAAELFSAGVQVITSGNHIWVQREMLPMLDTDAPVLRPLNYPDGVPGRGHLAISLPAGEVMIVNLIGRVFMGEYESPFLAIDRVLARTPSTTPVIVDFHAEATSEKQAMGWYLAGRVAAILGTHTHVATADARVLSPGTAYVSDVGMVGPAKSVIGADVDDVIPHFLTSMPSRFEVADGPAMFNSVLIDIDRKTGRSTSIRRLDFWPESGR